MKPLIQRVRDEIQAAIGDVISPNVEWDVERPTRIEHGDFSANVAIRLAKIGVLKPLVIAADLAQRITDYRSALISEVVIAGPGFLNFRLFPKAWLNELQHILEVGTDYGRKAAGSGPRVNLEFVSANPTGPLLVSHARGAVLGDTIARVLEATGHRVTREYYVNDFGKQVALLAQSIEAHQQGAAVPEDGYKGEYVQEMAKHLAGTRPESLTQVAVRYMLVEIQKTLRKLDVAFDVWTRERAFHAGGYVDDVFERLETQGHLTARDGAVVFRASGDEDRVVRKTDGSYTYFASELAYIQDKAERGFDRFLITLGADHHGYVPRMRNAFEVFGVEPERFEAIIYQLVFLTKGGTSQKFSKRAGTAVTINEVVDEIDRESSLPNAGRDALRFFFLSRTSDKEVDFDIDLAKQRSLDNPVFYVQYGYARLRSILRGAEALGIEPDPPSEVIWTHLGNPEMVITRKLAEFPEVVELAAKLREPHRLAFYVTDLAREFQRYFTQNSSDPVLPPKGTDLSTWNVDKTRARLAWINAIENVYKAALNIIGITAPQERIGDHA